MENDASPRLPPELWTLVAHELASDGSLRSLFHLACVSREMASLALPELYANYHHCRDRREEFFRIIFSSCLDTTLFPYYMWMTDLMIYDLESLTNQVPRPDSTPFFVGPLEKLLVLEPWGTHDTAATVGRMVDLFVKAVQRAAGQGKVSGITHVDSGLVTIDSSSKLAELLSNFPKLESLRARQRVQLDGHLGDAIRKNCPAFKELLLSIEGPWEYPGEPLASMAELLQNLEPGTLETFMSGYGYSATQGDIMAFAKHSPSLKYLDLFGISQDTIAALSALENCHRLEHLYICGDRWNVERTWRPAQLAQSLVRWISNCRKLRNLNLGNIPFLDLMVPEMLNSPTIRLHKLSLSMPTTDLNEGLYSALTQQTEFEELRLGWDEDVPVPNPEGRQDKHLMLVQAIAGCSKLRKLELVEPISPDTTARICEALPLLESIELHVPRLEDVYIDALVPLRSVKIIKVRSDRSTLTAAPLERLCEAYARPGHRENHLGLYIELITKRGFPKISKEEFDRVDGTLGEYFGGIITLAPLIGGRSLLGDSDSEPNADDFGTSENENAADEDEHDQDNHHSQTEA